MITREESLTTHTFGSKERTDPFIISLTIICEGTDCTMNIFEFIQAVTLLFDEDSRNEYNEDNFYEELIDDLEIDN